MRRNRSHSIHPLRRTWHRLAHGALSPNWVWRVAHPRRLHAYCIGTPKSGTHSVAAMLQAGYRVRHEPWLHPSIQAILRNGATSHADLCNQPTMVNFVVRRDRTLWLEFESSHVPGHFIDILVTHFPNARFVLTLRDCRGWLNSILNHYLNRYPDLAHSRRPVLQTLREFNAHRFRLAECVHRPEERVLAEHGLYPIDAYLAYWARHNERILSAVPRDRLLLVRTDRLKSESRRIADFLEIPVERVDTEASHRYRAPHDHALLRHIHPAFLEDRLERHCGPLMARHFQ